MEKFVITAINEKGERFTLEFESPYIFKKKLNRMQHSKKISVVFHSDIPS